MDAGRVRLPAPPLKASPRKPASPAYNPQTRARKPIECVLVIHHPKLTEIKSKKTNNRNTSKKTTIQMGPALLFESITLTFRHPD
jgi:hypothetical protein